MEIEYSRPVRITSTGTAQKVYSSGVSVSAVSLTVITGDAYVELTDGPGGQVLWDISADDATSSPCHPFPKPLLFKNGVYANITEDIPDGFKALNVALVIPASAGT